MLVVTAMLLIGLLAGIAGTQVGNLRLGGVVVVPLISVYLLRSFGTFPVFVLSTAAAYVSLYLIKRRLLLYGRPLFVTSVLIGALIPVLVFEVLAVAVGLSEQLSAVEFFGSVLPGIAAYNYHRMDSERRVLDMIWSLTVVLFLTVVGIGLVIVVGLTPLADVLPPVLLGPQSDIAAGFGLTVDRPPVPTVASSGVTVAVFAFGMTLSELFRSRYGLRIAGVVVVPLVVLAAVRNQWMLPLWCLTAGAAYVGIRVTHWWTLLYGRVLLSLGVILGLLTAVSLTTVVPVRTGLLPFFVGILGGVTGYNYHVVPPAERRATVLVTGTVFVIVAAVVRIVVTPPATGLLSTVREWHYALGVALAVPGLWELVRLERIRPGGSDERGPASSPGQQDGETI
jgi:hypothetical protein